MAIRRNISVLNQSIVAEIDIIYGTDLLPIEFYITDYMIPDNAIAVLYCITSEEELFKVVGTIENNTISFDPTVGFFAVGRNRLQIRITIEEKEVYSFEVKVNCEPNIASDDAQEVESQPTLMAQLLTEIANIKSYVNMALSEVENPDIDSWYNGVATERIDPVLPITSGDTLKSILSTLTMVANNEEYNYNLIQLLTNQRSHVGMIVQSTALDTEEKVINLYGGTSWELIRGKFLLGESDEYPVGTTGGKSVYKLTAAIGACNGDSTSIGYVAADYSAYQASIPASYMLNGSTNQYGFWNHGTPVTDASSSSRDTTIIPPYKTVYIWERIE